MRLSSMAIESIAIIPDGTRRWARREQVSLTAGYHHAFKNLLNHVDALAQRGIKDIHLYLFSIYNLKRLREEVQACLDAECVFIENLTTRKYNISITGDLDALAQVHGAIAAAARNASSNAPMIGKTTIHLYIGYSFQQHLESILKNETFVASAITTLMKLKLDLVIRTGDAVTLSDFLPIESRYSQIYFLPALFNDLSVEELLKLCDRFDQQSSCLKYGE